MTLGQQIRRARRDAGLTDDEQFARDLGVTVATLYAWQADIEVPSDEQLRHIAELTALDPTALTHLAREVAPSGICSPVDLVPSSEQSDILLQVGLPKELWGDPDRWVAFLRLARAASTLSPEEMSLLAEHAEACVSGSRGV